jgi:predicted small lipoprotein YifL
MKYAFCSHNSLLAALFVMLTVLSLFWVGCGKKGPPRPPQRPLPPKVKDLAYSLRNDRVELSWTVPGAEGNSTSFPAAVKVFRFRRSAKEAGCENCPIRYTVSGDIPIQKKQAEKSEPIRMHYAESVEPGYRYIYKVTVYDEYGIAGKDSNVVKFDHHSD